MQKHPNLFQQAPKISSLSQRDERGSTLITSNLPFQEWTEILG